MKSLPLDTIIAYLPFDSQLEANKELARRVSCNIKEAIAYYISPLCDIIVEHISNNIVYRPAYGEFYEFISSPYEGDTPTWKKIASYKGVNGCTLKTYTSNISCRYFSKVAKKERQESFSKKPILEYMDYEDLLGCDTYESEDAAIIKSAIQRAYRALGEKDRLVLHCLVIKKKPSIEAYDILKDFITPRPRNNMTSEEIKASLTIKQKQDAMALLKGRALSHLLVLYKEQLRLS